MDKEKLIIYFSPEDKKIQKNQFHVEAPNNKEAIEIMKTKLNFNVKVLGIAYFTWNNEQFINYAIY